MKFGCVYKPDPIIMGRVTQTSVGESYEFTHVRDTVITRPSVPTAILHYCESKNMAHQAMPCSKKERPGGSCYQPRLGTRQILSEYYSRNILPMGCRCCIVYQTCKRHNNVQRPYQWAWQRLMMLKQQR
jgi:hypothetical protein